MKSYDETVDSVFDRIDKYNSEKIRRNKIITKAVVPACCFCLIALGGIGAWKSGLFKSGTPGAVPGQPVTSYDNAAAEIRDHKILLFGLSGGIAADCCREQNLHAFAVDSDACDLAAV